MDTQHLIDMANRIGAFFEAMPDRDEALNGIAQHIHRFWAPRMRQTLAADIAEGRAGALMPLVREALAAHPQALRAEPSHEG